MKTPRKIFREYLVEKLVKKIAKNSPVKKFLEIGGGAGEFSQKLSQLIPGPNLMIDFSPQAIQLAKAKNKNKNLALAKKDFLKTKLVKKFNLIIMLEVLEHIKKEGLALKKISRLLDKNGYLIISVPAGKRLNPFDKKVGHFRKYSKAQLKKLLDQNGFKTIYLKQYGYPFLNLLEIIRIKAIDKKAAIKKEKQTKESFCGPFVSWPSFLNFFINRFSLLPLISISNLFNTFDRGNGLVCCCQKKR